jgi:hypothetical protein
MRIAVLCMLAGCSGGSTSSTASSTTPPTTSTESPSPAEGSAATGTTAASVTGFYSGQWGQLVLREKDGRMLAVYSHDQGTISGTLQGDTLVGWWCEVPSRKPDQDAGDVELKFITKDGAPAIDGRWRYGATADWRDDWDIAKANGEPDPALLARFDDPTAFCTKP